MKRLIIIAYIAGIPFACAAESKYPIDTDFEKCLSVKQNMTTSGMVSCTDQAAQEWDIELNKVYKLLMSKLHAEGQKNLRASQRAWVQYKELEIKNINTIYDGVDGTMYVPMRVMDILSITKTRTLELNGYLSTISMQGEK